MAMIVKRKELVFGLVIAAVIILSMIIIVLNFVWQSESNPSGEPDPQPNVTKSPVKVNPPSNESKPESGGGSITFSLRAGTYEERAEIELSHENLQYKNGDDIPSDIHYTTDGTEPTRENARKYNPGEKIMFNKPGKYTIKAKLFSKLGKYEGKVYSQKYTIKQKPKKIPVIVKPVPEPVKPKTEINKPDSTFTKPEPQKPVIPDIVTIKNFMQLDDDVRQDFYESTKKIVFEVEGIEKIEKINRQIKMEISLSEYGQAKMEKISGFKVIPQDKGGKVRVALAQKIENTKFLSPARNGKPVKARIWIDFRKVAKFKNQIILIR